MICLCTEKIDISFELCFAYTMELYPLLLQKNDSSVSSKKKETSKLTKHGFLDKIKAAAKTKGSEGQNDSEIVKEDRKGPNENGGTNRSSWGALRDDFMLGSKKVSKYIAMIDNYGLSLKMFSFIEQNFILNCLTNYENLILLNKELGRRIVG